MIPYGRQNIDADDIDAVTSVLGSDWLTTGPMVGAFERALAGHVGSRFAVAVSSGTAALHSVMFALDISPGDEVIVPAITFAATANVVVFQGGTPVFADVAPDTLLIDPDDVERRISKKTKAIVAVDYAGQPCDYERLWDLCRRHDLHLVADGCHALGALYRGKPVGTLADLTVFSFHPVKHITTGEGGMITTDDPAFDNRMRIFRNHGIDATSHQREERNTWEYAIVALGYNYRITDIQCALGLQQLTKLPAFCTKRREIAKAYDEAFDGIDGITPLSVREEVMHAFHLYVVRIAFADFNTTRAAVFHHLRRDGIGVNVHYLPVYLHPFYRKRLGTGPGLCPNAEAAYEAILSLPIFPGMDAGHIEEVVDKLGWALAAQPA
jgi:perosamine synthetase